MRCNQCKYFNIVGVPDDGINGDCRNGECHRFPPQLNQVAIQQACDSGRVCSMALVCVTEPSSSGFPGVYGDNWCGEFCEIDLWVMSIESCAVSVRARKEARRLGAETLNAMWLILGDETKWTGGRNLKTRAKIREEWLGFGIDILMRSKT